MWPNLAKKALPFPCVVGYYSTESSDAMLEVSHTKHLTPRVSCPFLVADAGPCFSLGRPVHHTVPLYPTCLPDPPPDRTARHLDCPTNKTGEQSPRCGLSLSARTWQAHVQA
jgi:hypothetical protein